MQVEFPYGRGTVTGSVPWARCLGVLDVVPAAPLPDVPRALRDGLQHPIGTPAPLLEPVGRGHRVLIIVSDSFRQTGIAQCLPALIEALAQQGVCDTGIRFLVATGIHRALTEEELTAILGPEMHARFRARVACHDAHDAAGLVDVGTTSRGTRVQVNRAAVDADHVIVTGTTVLHYFAGFGGGRKSIVPGISSAGTISQNHSLNLDPVTGELNPDVRIGRLDGNPVAEDQLEAARMVRTTGMINTVLNRDSAIAGLFVGELEAAHRQAAAFALRTFAAPVEERADLVIAAAGPRKNFVQAHKALFNAYQAVKPNGRIVFIARCEEGLGGQQFEKWLRLGSRSAIIEGLRRRSEINGQTALSTLEKAPIAWFVTDLPPEDVAALHARRAVSLEDALERARQELAAAGTSNPTCYIMPQAASSVPFLGATPRLA